MIFDMRVTDFSAPRSEMFSAALDMAEWADGFIVPLMSKEIWQPYREECLRLNKPDPGEYPRQGPTFLWISETTVPST